MYNNILILGNGFDLDLGLQTKYSDFANSDYWPKANGKSNDSRTKVSKAKNGLNIYTTSTSKPRQLLEHHLDKKRAFNNWFDLENEILIYAKIDETKMSYNKDSDYFIAQNNDYYLKLQDGLCNYILNIQNNATINRDSIAYNVLDNILKNGYFNKIYSFNYTNLKKLIPEFNIESEIIHLHGMVDDNSIILGVDETPLKKGYECFHKSSSKYYNSHDIYNDITNADELVIFGLSFGGIDYCYFENYFKNLSTIKSTPNEKKQNITIFTKDDNSRLDITSRLRDMNISIQNLYAQSNFKIICTNDGINSTDLTRFRDRLIENSSENYYKNLEIFSNNLM